MERAQPIYDVSINDGDQWADSLVNSAQEDRNLEVVVLRNRHCSLLANHQGTQVQIL